MTICAAILARNEAGRITHALAFTLTTGGEVTGLLADNTVYFLSPFEGTATLADHAPVGCPFPLAA